MRRKRIIEKGEEMEGKRRDEEDMQDSLVVEEGMMFNFPLVPLPLVSFICSSCYNILSAKKKLNNHIVEMHKEPASCILCLMLFKKNLYIGDRFVHFPSSYTCKTWGTAFGEEKASQGTISPATCRSALLARSVQLLWQEIPACLNTCWWFMELGVPHQQ